MSIRVAVVEDDELVRENLTRLIHETDGFECVASFATGEQAIQAWPRRVPHVAIMDINLPGMSGVECVRQLKSRFPEVNVVMLTVYDDSERIFQALKMGASGYLLKRSTTAEILQAIQDVHQGGAPMTSYIARKVVQSFRQQRATEKPAEALSKRETEVLDYVARGYSNKEIADALSISLETVRTHLKRIYEKLHVRSRTEAAMLLFGK